MAATLDANITSTQRRFTASETISGLTQGNLLRIGDELLEFVAYQVPRKPSLLDEAKLVTNRGVLGTTKASHLSGAAILGVQVAVVTSEDDSSPDPFGGGGGGVTVTVPPAAAVPVTNFNIPTATIDGDTATLRTLQLIGPFTAAFDDSGVQSAPGVLLTTLPAGTFIEGVRPVLPERFDDGNGGPIEAAFRVYLTDHSDWWLLNKSQVGFHNDAEDTESEGLLLEAYPYANLDGLILGEQARRAALTTTVAWELRVIVGTGADPLSKGTMDVYAIIATPAS